MRKRGFLSRRLFQLVVKTPIISILLVLLIAMFVYTALFRYQIDRELDGEGKLVPEVSKTGYVLELSVDKQLANSISPTGTVTWIHNDHKYKAPIVSVNTKGNLITIQSKPVTQDVIKEFGSATTDVAQEVSYSVIIGKERIIDKLSGNEVGR